MISKDIFNGMRSRNGYLWLAPTISIFTIPSIANWCCWTFFFRVESKTIWISGLLLNCNWNVLKYSYMLSVRPICLLFTQNKSRWRVNRICLIMFTYNMQYGSLCIHTIQDKHWRLICRINSTSCMAYGNTFSHYTGLAQKKSKHL